MAYIKCVNNSKVMSTIIEISLTFFKIEKENKNKIDLNISHVFLEPFHTYLSARNHPQTTGTAGVFFCRFNCVLFFFDNKINT